MAMVNVPKDMKSRARALCRVPQLLAADVLARLGPVEHELGRAVSDQNIDARRYQVPLLAKLRAADLPPAPTSATSITGSLSA